MGAPATAAPPRPIVPTDGWIAQPSLERAVLVGINDARVAAGLGRVRSSAVLKRPARAQSKYLAVSLKGKLRHQDAQGHPFHRRLVRAGWEPNTRMSENLFSITACRAKDPSIAVRRWLASAAHRKNMLDPKVTHVGVGIVSTRRCGVSVYTTDFGQLKKGLPIRGETRWVTDARRPSTEGNGGILTPNAANRLVETQIDPPPREIIPPPAAAPETPSSEPPKDDTTDEDPGERKGLITAKTAPNSAKRGGRAQPRIRQSATRPKA